jgi:hypothetical protein
MTQAITNNINNVIKYKERLLIALVSGIAIFGFMYVYLLHSAVTNVVAREDIIKESRMVSTRVSELEAKYFQVKDTINIQLAHEKGFKDSEISSFISKKSLTAMANINEL